MVGYLENQLKYFKGNTMWLPGKPGLMTNEGPTAVQEAIAFLKQMQPLKALTWSDALWLSTRDHCYD